MADLRALQEACLSDRRERDNWHSAFLTEQERRRAAEQRLAAESEAAAQLLQAVATHRSVQQAEVRAGSQKLVLQQAAGCSNYYAATKCSERGSLQCTPAPFGLGLVTPFTLRPPSCLLASRSPRRYSTRPHCCS